MKTSDFYYDLAEAISSSDETVRKWYSNGGPSPTDIALVEAIAEYVGLNVIDLLEEKEDVNTMNMEITVNTDREIVKQIYTEMLNFAEQLAYGAFSEKVKTDTDDWDSWNMNKIFDALLKIHMSIDKASMDIKSDTAKKLHDIVLTYTENVMCHDLSVKWDALCTNDYPIARRLLASTQNWEYWNWTEEDEEEYGLKAYLKKIYPWVYEDEEDFLEIPFTYQFIYLREFAATLNNVFRNDFPEYFINE